MTNRYKRLGLNEYQGNKAQRELLGKGLIEEVKLLGFKGKGYWGKTFNITDKGRIMLKQLGMQVEQDTLRKGSLKHQYLARMIAEKLHKEGHVVKEEYPLGSGKAIDLLIDDRIAIEIQRSTDHVLENAEKNLTANFQVVIIAETKELTIKLSNLIEQHSFKGQVIVVSASEFMDNPVPILSSF